MWLLSLQRMIRTRVLLPDCKGQDSAVDGGMGQLRTCVARHPLARQPALVQTIVKSLQREGAGGCRALAQALLLHQLVHILAHVQLALPASAQVQRHALANVLVSLSKVHAAVRVPSQNAAVEIV